MNTAQDDIDEVVRYGECDSCGEGAKLNRFCLCKSCDESHQAFNKGVWAAMKQGASREDAYTAGMLAMKEWEARNA